MNGYGMNDTDSTDDIWLSPPQVSDEFGTNVRTVYRWIEDKKVTFKTVGRNKFVTRDSVESLLKRQQIHHIVSEVIPSDTPAGDVREGLTASITRNDSERHQLYIRAAEDARTIGELTERTRHLEELSEEVVGLRKRVERLVQYRVLFWTFLALLMASVVIFSVLLWFTI